jgi:3D (Asp-Asp-Asp) domain-containing protein
MSSSTGDIATQIKAMFQRRKDLLKEKKKKNIFIGCAIFAAFLAGVFYVRSVIIENEYLEKQLELVRQKADLEEQQLAIKEQMAQAQRDQEEKNSKLQKTLQDAELVIQNNLYLVEQNIKLQNFLKEAAYVGIKPKNYNVADEVNEAVDFSKLEYIGEFEGTAYTPTAEECGNNLGYTASGKPIIAGVSVAVDNKYWKMGTKFYIEGLGFVVAMDTGSAVKGKYRFDYAVFDKKYALQIGRRKYKTYLVLESGDKN